MTSRSMNSPRTRDFPLVNIPGSGNNYKELLQIFEEIEILPRYDLEVRRSSLMEKPKDENLLSLSASCVFTPWGLIGAVVHS